MSKDHYALQNSIADMRDTNAQLHGRVVAAERAATGAQAVASKVNVLTDRVCAVEEDDDEQHKAFTRLDEDRNTRLTKLEQKANIHDRTLKSIEAQLREAEGASNNAISQRFGMVDLRIRQLETAYTTMVKSLSRNDQVQQENGAEFQAINTRCGNLEKQMVELKHIRNTIEKTQLGLEQVRKKPAKGPSRSTASTTVPASPAATRPKVNTVCPKVALQKPVMSEPELAPQGRSLRPRQIPSQDVASDFAEVGFKTTRSGHLFNTQHDSGFSRANGQDKRASSPTPTRSNIKKRPRVAPLPTSKNDKSSGVIRRSVPDLRVRQYAGSALILPSSKAEPEPNLRQDVISNSELTPVSAAFKPLPQQLNRGRSKRKILLPDISSDIEEDEGIDSAF